MRKEMNSFEMSYEDESMNRKSGFLHRNSPWM